MKLAACGRRIYVPVATRLFGTQVEVQALFCVRMLGYPTTACGKCCRCGGALHRSYRGQSGNTCPRKSVRPSFLSPECLWFPWWRGMPSPWDKPSTFASRQAVVRARGLRKRLPLPCFPSAARTLLCANPAISASQLPPPKGPSSSITAGGE